MPQNRRSRNQAPPKTSKGPNTACVVGARASAILDAACSGGRGQRVGQHAQTRGQAGLSGCRHKGGRWDERFAEVGMQGTGQTPPHLRYLGEWLMCVFHLLHPTKCALQALRAALQQLIRTRQPADCALQALRAALQQLVCTRQPTDRALQALRAALQQLIRTRQPADCALQALRAALQQLVCTRQPADRALQPL